MAGVTLLGHLGLPLTELGISASLESHSIEDGITCASPQILHIPHHTVMETASSEQAGACHWSPAPMKSSPKATQSQVGLKGATFCPY